MTVIFSSRTIYRFAFPLAIISAILAGYEVLTQSGSGQGATALPQDRAWVPASGNDANAQPADASAESVRLPGVERSPEHRAAAGADVDDAAPDPAAQFARDLTDADENVRQQALFAAAGSGDPLPRHTLEKMLSYDSSELARRSALEALNVHPEVDPGTLQAFLLRAQADPSPLVRESAAAIAESLSTPTETLVDYGPANTPDTDAGELIQAPETGNPSLAAE